MSYDLSNNLFFSDYVASVDEEKKTVVRKLTKEKDELKEENDSLKKKIRELEKNHGILSVPSLVCL